MHFNFEKDILDWGTKTICRLGYVPAHKNKASDRLAEVFEILRNRIPPVPRKIQIAKHFYCPEKYIEGYEQVIAEIESGIDLAPRCSRQQTNKSIYYDGMLLDWGIHHLHLGIDKIRKGKSKGLIEGYKEILFVFFTDEIAHIIGVFDHLSWAKLEVLRIVYDNWPHLLEHCKFIRASDCGEEITDEQRKVFRQKNVNSFVKLGKDEFFGPGGGITSAGTGTNEILKAQIVLRAVDSLEEWLSLNIRHIEQSENIKLDKIKFDVSRYIITQTFSIYDSIHKIRIFIPSTEPAGSLIHPALADIVEPIKDNHLFFEPGSFSGILIQYLE